MIEKIKDALRKLGEQLSEEQWYQEAKAKWEELDPQSKLYVKLGSAAAAMLAVLWVVIGSVVSVYGLKSDMAERNELLNLVTAAGEEMRDLKTAGRSAGTPGRKPNWKAFFESSAGTAGVDAKSLDVSGEKKGQDEGKTEEALYTLSLKRVNIRQVVRFAFQLENGNDPVKVRNLKIVTDGAEGYVDATLAVSAFTLKE